MDIAISKGHPAGLPPLLDSYNAHLIKKAELFQTVQTHDIKKTTAFVEKNAWRFSPFDLAESSEFSVGNNRANQPFSAYLCV